jgi:polar amino acid transport system substrate-binding protein
MRKLTFAALGLLVVLLAAACGSSTKESSPGTTAAAADSCATNQLYLVKSGTLTVGTDNPAYPPWFGGDEKAPWKISDPTSGKGYESAVAYAVAKQLGFSRAQVAWKYTPFNNSFAPGKKAFDFDINPISFSSQRAKVVDFSDSYYDVNQAVVVNKGTKIASVTSPAGLKSFELGAQLGTTSYQYIVNRIKPSKKPGVYPKNDFAVTALKNGQIDGLVVDLPTAFYVTAVQVPNSKILGQFPNVGKSPEHFGMVFQKGNPLVGCVNQALKNLKANGTLKKINTTWLSRVVGVPVLK